MADLMLDEDERDNMPVSRASLAQVRALVEFIEKHPDLTHKKLRTGISRQKVKKLWIQISNVLNSLEGTLKSTKGWIKFWYDKRRNTILKQKQIDEGKIPCTLSSIEQRIFDLGIFNDKNTKKKKIKVDQCNGDDEDYMEDLFPDSEDLDLNMDSNKMPTEAEERQFSLIEKLIDVMDQQAQAMAQIAHATHSNSKALERFAEASHLQALAVDRVANTFENITSSVHDVRNSIINIDYSMKRCYANSTTLQRQNSNLFS